MRAIKILLVVDEEDDYIVIRDLLSTGISTHKYRLSWCSGYSDAINAMLKDRYDLYLVDSSIGAYSCLDLLKEAVSSNCTRPIIIMTGTGDKRIDEEALEAGAADYLTKDRMSSETLERSIRYATRQFETLNKLKQSEHTFRTLFERSQDAIVISDTAGHILDANKSALDFFGMDYTDVGEINCAFFYRLPKERRIFIEVLQREGSVHDMLVELITLNGDIKTCCVSSFIEIPQHGDTELLYTFIKDVSYTPELTLPSYFQEDAYPIKAQLPQSVKAVRVSLSKIVAAVEKKADLEACPEEAALFDTIRMNASFADQALKNLEDQLDRQER
ncbi:MAG: response regulator [Arcticibacter sp.]